MKYISSREWNVRVFSSVHGRSAKSSCFFTYRSERGCVTMTDYKRADLDHQIMRLVNANMRINTRDLSLRTGVLQSLVWNVLSHESLHPYHLLTVQYLLPEEFERRQSFCIWLPVARSSYREIDYSRVYRIY